MNDVLVLRVTGPFLLSGNGCILTFTCLSLSRVVGFLVLLMSSSADMLERISLHGQKCAQQSTISSKMPYTHIPGYTLESNMGLWYG